MSRLLGITLFLVFCLSSCEVSYKKSRISEGNVSGGEGVILNAKVCLEGAYISDSPILMSSDLSDQYLLPTASPFTGAAPWFHYSSNDLSVGQDFLDAVSAVDWVVVQVFKYENGSYVFQDSQSALISENGILYDTLGLQGISFPSLSNGNYYFNILSRNHLSVASEDPTYLSSSYSSNTFNIDFTLTSTPYLDEDTLSPHTTVTTGTLKCLLAGDTNGDLAILESDVDADPIFPDGYVLAQEIAASIAGPYQDNVAIIGYKKSDVNLDGQIQIYTDHPGTIEAPDKSLMLQNDGKTGSLY